MSEENWQLRRRIAELQKQLTLTQTAQRRGEAEAAKLRLSLARAEEMLGQREAGALSPNSMVGQLHRTPETSNLVASLRQRLDECEAAREDLRRELERLAKSTRATTVAELHAEALACGEETGRQLARAELLAGRATAAAAEAAELRRKLAEQSESHAAEKARMEQALRQLHDALGGAAMAGGPGGCQQSAVTDHTTQCSTGHANRSDGREPVAASGGSGASRGGGSSCNPLAAVNTAATVADVTACAEVLLSHAHQIDARVPLGPAHRGNMAVMEAWARNRGPQVAGAPAVLRALRAHQGRLHAALAALPGGPIFTNASLAALTAQAARAAAQLAADVPEPRQGSEVGISSGARAPPASAPQPQLRQLPFPVPPLKLPGPSPAGSAASPWMPSPVAEEDPDEVESLESVPGEASPAPYRADVGSSPRPAAGVGSQQGAASPAAGTGRLLSGRVENRSKYDVMRGRQQQQQSAPVPLLALDRTQGYGSGHVPPGTGVGQPPKAVGMGAGVGVRAADPVKDDSWAELGVEEVDEDLDGDY
ncbi:hypothetical protein HXX76_004214 [Chlamydomonas incerta]|uniref:Uncharacterized protein n=1 Tax=Chlamydomonas incerta TaxID=51695 RepID=A0A835TJS0_CHLIN|nr:hypothetical protein HXX76_004214 [Chlamydomonas incerta]|eukprot:KAG2440100.1 hypothetical protein HXX76_004214 [Chlamydomonas incerta]